jgi:hypothetical protein
MKEPVDHNPATTIALTLGQRGGDHRMRLWRFEGADADAPRVFSLKDLGRKRTAMLTCMTCADTAARWGTWDDDPRRALEREIAWEWGGGYRAREDRGSQLKDELGTATSSKRW